MVRHAHSHAAGQESFQLIGPRTKTRAIGRLFSRSSWNIFVWSAVPVYATQLFVSVFITPLYSVAYSLPGMIGLSVIWGGVCAFVTVKYLQREARLKIIRALEKGYRRIEEARNLTAQFVEEFETVSKESFHTLSLQNDREFFQLQEFERELSKILLGIELAGKDTKLESLFEAVKLIERPIKLKDIFKPGAEPQLIPALKAKIFAEEQMQKLQGVFEQRRATAEQIKEMKAQTEGALASGE